MGACAAIVASILAGKLVDASGAYPLEAGVREATVSLQDWLLARLNSALSYIQDPTTLVFRVINPVANFLVEHLVVPFRDLFMQAPWFATLAALVLIAYVVSGVRPALTTLVALLLVGAIGDLVEGDGHVRPGGRRDALHRADRARPRRCRGREPAGLERAPSDQRRPPDPAAARLHRPADLPRHRLLHPGHRGRCSLRRPGRRPPRRAGAQGRCAAGRRGRDVVRGDPPPGAVEGAACRSPATRSCSASTRGSSWCSRSS